MNLSLILQLVLCLIQTAQVYGQQIFDASSPQNLSTYSRNYYDCSARVSYPMIAFVCGEVVNYGFFGKQMNATKVTFFHTPIINKLQLIVSGSNKGLFVGDPDCRP